MLNKVILIGRLTKDPEMRVSSTGNPVGTFTLAVNRNFAGTNGEREADFLNCVCFTKLADNVGRYCKKGMLVSVEGRIQTRTYDAQDGSKRYVTEVVCENVVFLESRQSQNENVGNQYQQQYPSFNQQQPSFNINKNQQQPQNRNNNFAGNNNYSQPKNDYFDENPNIDISEDDLPF